MTVKEVVEKYGLSLQVEISEMSVEQREELVKDMESIGFKPNWCEKRYKSCTMQIFTK